MNHTRINQKLSYVRHILSARGNSDRKYSLHEDYERDLIWFIAYLDKWTVQHKKVFSIFFRKIKKK